MEKKKSKKFVYKGFGFPVVLYNVPMAKVRGKWTPLIDFSRLMKVVLIALCHQTDPLTGNQVAFIRHYFEMTGKEFGRKFGVTQACVSKWEARGNESAKMDAATEVCVKIYVFESLHQEIELIVKKQLLDRDLQRKSKVHELKPAPISLEEEDIKECMYG